MRQSGLQVNELQTPLAGAWTALLAERLDEADVWVETVSAEYLSPTRTRFTLHLAEHAEPIAVLGCAVTPLEAEFYRTAARRLTFLTPPCWFSHVGSTEGWVVLDEWAGPLPPAAWTAPDADAVITDLAYAHSLFWSLDREWLDYDWLPLRLGMGALPSLAHAWRLGPPEGLSLHALVSAGLLADGFRRAGAGLVTIRRLGGWPGALEGAALSAVADLLDDPVPALFALRELPMTLLHGAPRPDNWRTTPLGRRWLLNWGRAAWGPGVCDLAAALEGLAEQAPVAVYGRALDDWWELEEQLVDSYVLKLAVELGRRVNLRAVRRALPAARCLHFMLYWLPRLDLWLRPLRARPQVWRDLWTQPAADWPAAWQPLVGLTARLQGASQRFLRAYYQL